MRVVLAFTGLQNIRSQPNRGIVSTPRPTTTVLFNAIGDMIRLDDSNRRDVLGGGGKPVLIDVFAPWCGPCKLIEPVLERCAETWGSSLDVVRYDVESENTSTLKMELLMDNVIVTKLPSLVLYENGKAIATRSGLINDEEMDEFLSSNLSNAKAENKAKSRKLKTGGKISFGAAFERDDYALGS